MHLPFPGLISYKPNPQAIPFHQSRARFRVIRSGSRAGKTYAVSREFLMMVLRDVDVYLRSNQRWPYLRYWIVAPDYSLTEEAQDMVLGVLGGPASKWVGRWYARNRKLWLNGLPVLIQFKSAHDPNTLKAVGLNGIWCDEAALIRREAWLGSLRSRISDRKGWAIFSSTPHGKNWYYRDIRLPAEFGREGWSYHEFTTEGNIAAPDLIEEAKLMQVELGDTYYRRECLGQEDSYTGLVFPDFDRDRHTIAELPSNDLWDYRFVGMDFGWSDPTAVVAAGTINRQEGYGRRVYLLHDEQASQVLLDGDGDTWEQRLKRLLTKVRPNGVYGDPRGATEMALLRRADIPIKAAQVSFNRSIEYISGLLRKDELKIHLTCKAIINEFESWEWKEDSDLPKRGTDHSIDALRYALCKLIERKGAFSIMDTHALDRIEQVSGVFAGIMDKMF